MRKNDDTADAPMSGARLWREPGLWAALGIGLLAAIHWFTGLCYSRGYDYFLWLYNAWLSAEHIAAANWPEWSPFSAAGHPFFKMAGLSDALLFACFIAPLGMDVGTQVYAISLYAASAVGLYALARHLGATQAGAVVAAAAYAFSWFLTYTAYYQTYLSNFLSYAMMPWGALLLAVAIRSSSRGHLLAAAAMLFVSMTSNAQVSIRFMLFVVPLAWIDAVICGGANARRALFYCTGFVGIAVCWSAFLIVPALALRSEVLLLGEVRGNWFMPPWAMLTWLPLSGLHILSQQLGGAGFLDSEILFWTMHSDYLGLSVVAIATAGSLAQRAQRRTRWLLILLLVYFAIYFLLVPNLRASAFVGRTHNWAVLPTLILALLCPHGCSYLAQRWRGVRSQGRAGILLCALIGLDLGGASYALNRIGVTHTPLAELPEVAIWRAAWAKEGISGTGRWFTFNPDHTHYLYPVLMGRETANVVELRLRNREYNSFIQHQFESVRSLDLTYNPGESLALLNCRFVDLPQRLFDYRSETDHFAEGVALLQRDAHLTEVIRREWQPLDEGYDASRAYEEIVDLANNSGKDGAIAQIVWRNEKAHWGFLPEKTVLLVGESLASQHFFERVTHLAGLRADRILFVFNGAGEEGLDPRVVEALDAQIVLQGGEPIADLPEWELEHIDEFYTTPYAPVVRPQLLAEKVGEIAVKMEPLARPSFLFLSRQRFVDWQAYDELGQPLPVFKASAGLTAIFAPGDNSTITYRYELPDRERIARIFSLFCVVLALVWWRGGTVNGAEE